MKRFCDVIHQLFTILRAKGPALCLAQPSGLGLPAHHLITRAKGPAICCAPNQHARVKESNGRTVGPTVFHLVRYPGRWPGLSKCPGLRPSIQNDLTRKRLVFNIGCDANRLRETGQHALSPRHWGQGATEAVLNLNDTQDNTNTRFADNVHSSSNHRAGPTGV